MTTTKKILILATIAFLFSCEKEDPTGPKAKSCFDYSPNTELEAGDEITFSNCSENATVFAWDFGDGSISTEKGPKHTYVKGGEFTVKLIVGNESSADTMSKTITIHSEIITHNRWKEPDLWNDICEEDNKPISGYEYLTFTSDHKVIYELELIGESACGGDVEEMGTWYKEDGKYYIVIIGHSDGSNVSITEKYEVTISKDGKTLCIKGEDGDECYVKE